MLALTEMEEAQAQAPGAIVNHANEGAAAAVLNLSNLDLAAYHGFLTGPQRADGTQAGTVLVTQRKVEEEIL